MAQKVISKAEGRVVALASVEPSPRAIEIARQTEKDPKLVELILSESNSVVKARPGLLIVEHHLGFIMANAGIDQSNANLADQVILLPQDPDRSARQLRDSLRQYTGCDVGVIITDSWGRPWRRGTVGFAIGISGVPAVMDLRGHQDLRGRVLEATDVGVADEVAAAASLLMGQANEGQPVIVLRGLSLPEQDGCASNLLRCKNEDAFR